MKNRNLIRSFNNALSGILYAIKKEQNMKIHITVAILVLILSFFYRLSKIEFLIVCMTIGMVIICEIFNTAIEMIMNIIVDVYHPRVRRVKDMAAGAVLVSAFVSLIVAYFIFFDKMSFDLEVGIDVIKRSPIHVTIISLTVTIFIVFIAKVAIKKGTPFQGGMPSGHSAIAFATTTAVALIADDTRVAFLCLIIALLVVQSRLESKIHNIFELVAGAVLGFLVTLLVFQLLH